MEDCIFCKIVKKEIPSNIIWEDEKHIAFLSIFPNTEGFTVVATKEHLPSYAFDNDDKIVCDLTLATKKVAKMLDNYFDDVARCGMFFEGYGVDHLHSKLFPMHGTKSKISEGWKPIESQGEIKKEYYKEYPGYLSSHGGERADNDKLEELAKAIREKNSL